MASDKSQARPPAPWESTRAEEPEGSAQDPVKLLGELLLGKAGRPTGAIAHHEIRVSSGLVLGGLVLGLAGFAVIALAQFRDPTQTPFALRQLGGVLGGLGLLVLLWGILAGLPAHRSLRVLGLGGMAIGLVGVAAFAWAYPGQWGRAGVADQTVPVLGTYVAGLVLVVVATFASLVSDFVLRMQARGRLRGELGREPTDEEIQRDIDDAMRRHKVTWGGLGAMEGKGLKVKVEPLPKGWEMVMPKLGRETVATGARAAELDMSVDKLLDFRGGRQRRGEMPEAGLSNAADALKALRTAHEAVPKRSFWDRLFHRKVKVAPPPGYGPATMGGPAVPGPKR